MAKAFGFFGGGYGKAGQLVYYMDRGQMVNRAYNGHPIDPRTTRQVSARKRFGVASNLTKMVAYAVDLGFPRRKRLSRRDQFMRLVAPADSAAIRQSGDTFTVSWANLKVAKGAMPVPDVMLLNASETPAQVDIKLGSEYMPQRHGWSPSVAGEPGLVVLVVNDGQNQSIVAQVLAGSDTNVSVPCPSNWSGMHVEVYIFGKWVPESYTSVDARTLPWKFPSDTSDSYYCGTVTLL